jgi:hypothetical protein
MVLFASSGIALLAGCSTTNTRYVEEHDIRQLKVVFLDKRNLHERRMQVAGRGPIRFTAPMRSAAPMVKTVRGFYDYSSKHALLQKVELRILRA